MTLPNPDQLAETLTEYVDAPADQSTYIAKCVKRAIAFVTLRVPNNPPGLDGSVTSPLGDDLYESEVIELGSELFYRRQARNGVVSTAIDGTPIRVSADPYKASEARLTRHRPLGFA